MERWKKYRTFFGMYFVNSLQYRAAALSGMCTQLFFGLVMIVVYVVFYREHPEAYPTGLQTIVNYVWLQEGFLQMYLTIEMDQFDAIVDGTVAYELCRPLDLYTMWFTKSAAGRISRALMRCVPLLLVACLLPEPYGLRPPVSLQAGVMTAASMALGLGVAVAIGMVLYGVGFYTLSPLGIRTLALSCLNFFGGGVIPLPFFPDGVRRVVELLPFASMQNTPFLIYGGELTGGGLVWAVSLQVFWAAALILLGRLLLRRGMRQLVIQGG